MRGTYHRHLNIHIPTVLRQIGRLAMHPWTIVQTPLPLQNPLSILVDSNMCRHSLGRSSQNGIGPWAISLGTTWEPAKSQICRPQTRLTDSETGEQGKICPICELTALWVIWIQDVVWEPCSPDVEVPNTGTGLFVCDLLICCLLCTGVPNV
jgi:hypothetical protein